MTVLHLSLGSLNLNLHAPLRKVSIRSLQHMLLALQYEEASSHNIAIKYCIIFVILLFGCPGVSPRSHLLCTPLARITIPCMLCFSSANTQHAVQNLTDHTPTVASILLSWKCICVYTRRWNYAKHWVNAAILLQVFRFWSNTRCYLPNTYDYFVNILLCLEARTYQPFWLRSRTYVVRTWFNFSALCKKTVMHKLLGYEIYSCKINDSGKSCKRVENDINFFKESINMRQATDFHGGCPTGHVLIPWNTFCCPWGFSGVLENFWAVVKLFTLKLLITLNIQGSKFKQFNWREWLVQLTRSGW